MDQTRTKVSWTELKSLATTKSLDLQYVLDAGANYLVYIIDADFNAFSRILVTDPANADQTDFETNYLPTANKRIAPDIDTTFNMKTALYGGTDNTKIGNVGASLKTNTEISDGTEIAQVSVNGDMTVSDGLRNGGVQGVLTLTTADTAYEAKVGESRLAARKSLTITAEDNMFWGYDNMVTTSNGTPLRKNQQIVFAIDPDSTFQVWLVAAANTKSARITESP